MPAAPVPARGKRRAPYPPHRRASPRRGAGPGAPHVPAARRATHPAAARRRRGRAAPAAIPSAPARSRQPISVAPPRGALRRGRGAGTVWRFRSALSGLAQPVRRRRRSAERCCACSRDSSAPPLRRFTAAAVQSCESKVVVPSGWKFVCMSRARSADSCSLTDSCHLTVQHISARGVFPCYQCFCSQKKSPNTAIWGLLGQKLTPSQPSAVLNCYGK